MRRCTYIEGCPFFCDEIGYSPHLHETMKAHYCLGEYETCARFIAVETIGRDKVPHDLMPTETDRLPELGVEMP